MVKGALNFRISMAISSYPYEFLIFRDLPILKNVINYGIIPINSRKCAVKDVNQVIGRVHIISRVIILFDVSNSIVSNR